MFMTNPKWNALETNPGLRHDILATNYLRDIKALNLINNRILLYVYTQY
jgi:hypothetical protein